MNDKVIIIDYGLGNLLSVARAFKYCGADPVVTDSPCIIKNAERVVLPGVGAFSVGMNELKSRNLIDSLHEFISKERPFLGICLGMQMMLENSEEFGFHKGLGFIPGVVKAIPKININGHPHKIPHIGWNNLIYLPESNSWENTILNNIQINSAVYFVHSFMAIPNENKFRLADCNYNGIRISAVIKKGALYGCQFHPEKSGETGLKIIKEFLKF